MIKNLIKLDIQKEDSYSNINVEVITDGDFRQMRKVWENFEIGNYHDLFVQSNNFLLPDIFEHFWNIIHKIYELCRGRFLAAPGLA